MSLAAIAVKKRAVTYFATLLIVLGGFGAFQSLGQLEDPEYTVKTATIITHYPGASPKEVEREVTDRIETKIQEMNEIKWIESYSRHGESQVKVEILPTFWSDSLPQVWDHLRRKVREVETSLPPGADRPRIYDDFGDVFGFQLALIGDGFSPRQLEVFAKDIRRELTVVPGVARVDLWGVREQIIYLDVRETQLTQLGISTESIIDTLRQQNLVVDAGSLDLESKRFRIAPTGQFQSPADIADLLIRPSLLDTLQTGRARERAVAGSELIRISDIGTIRRGYREPPGNLLRMDGQPAIGISITNRPGVNIVEVGRAIDARLAELKPFFPIGVEWEKVHWQSDVVSEAVDNFLVSFLQAIAIVLVVLTLAMGWRMSVVIGTALVVTVFGTFIVMSMMAIDLHRVSLGALVIGLGMMVDNAIVVAEGMAVRLQQGMERTEAAVQAATQPAFPLLAATLVATMAFFPIAASPESTGEYCFSLFTVVAISLLVSWVVSLTLTPLQCIDMLKAPKASAQGGDPYQRGFYLRFRQLLAAVIRFRLMTVASAVALLVVAFVGFGEVRQLFFPASSMPKFMIDVFLPEGTRIQEVSAQMQRAEAKLMADERVAGVASYIGSGPPRFYLPVEPEESNQAYGQFVVNVHDHGDIADLVVELTAWGEAAFPDAIFQPRPFGVGPGKTWKFELRLSGPALTDPAELRALSQQFFDALNTSPYAGIMRSDWMNRVQRVEPQYNSERGRWAAVTRDDVANTTKRAFDGRDIGLYREGDDLIPIVLRHVGEERENVDGLETLQVRPELSAERLPLGQVLDGVVTVWEDPVVRRRDRRRTVKIQANAIPGETMPTMLASVQAQLDAIELPPGYFWEWGGEIEDERDSQAALVPGIIPALVVMVFLLVNQFNAFRPMLIMLLLIPFTVIGITAVLLAADIPFGFMSLLGAMALAGMMIKNSIVLLDQVEVELAAGKNRYDAIVDSAVLRLRPVLLAAGTTVLGVVPLLPDVFWVSMGATIMGGLTVGTVMTMVVLPALYAIFYRVPSPGSEAMRPAPAT